MQKLFNLRVNLVDLFHKHGYILIYIYTNVTFKYNDFAGFDQPSRLLHNMLNCHWQPTILIGKLKYIYINS